MKKLFISLSMLMFFVMLAACGSDDTSKEASKETAETPETEATGFVPSDQLDWTIAFGAGGGNDVMARTLISILDQYELYPEAITPNNREGGSGATGWGYLKSKAGSETDISTTSGSFVTTPLMSDPGFTYEDFTHIALMATDDMFLLVSGDSEFDTLEEFIAHATENRLSFGGTGVANVDRMVVATFAEEAEIGEYEYIPYDDQGLVLSDLLSGTTDVIVANPGDVPGQIAAGELKALAFSGQTRLPGDFSEIPTFLELGLDVNISMPRGVILPPDTSDEVKEYWIETMKVVADTPEWEEYINSNHLTEYIIYGDEFTEYLHETVDIFEEILTELGVLEK